MQNGKIFVLFGIECPVIVPCGGFFVGVLAVFWGFVNQHCQILNLVDVVAVGLYSCINGYDLF